MEDELGWLIPPTHPYTHTVKTIRNKNCLGLGLVPDYPLVKTRFLTMLDFPPLFALDMQDSDKELFLSLCSRWETRRMHIFRLKS